MKSISWRGILFVLMLLFLTLPALASKSPVVAQALPLTLGQTYSGAVHTAANEDRFFFQGAAGQIVLFDALDNDLENVAVTLVAPSGHEAASWFSYDDHPPIILLQTGTYTLRIASSAGTSATGDYSFRLIDLGVQPVIQPGSINGNFATGNEIVAYRLNATQGERYAFNLVGTESSNVSVYHNAILLGQAGAGIGGNEFLAPATGVYTVVVRGRETAADEYQLQMTRVNSPSGSNSGFGVRRTGTVSAEAPVTFNQTARAGTLAMMIPLSAEPNIFATLRGPNGETIVQRGPQSVFGPSFLPANGAYTVEVRSADGASPGTYDFVFLDLAGSAAATSFGQTYSSGANQFAVHRFDASAGDQFYYDGLEADFAPATVHIIAPSSNVIYSYHPDADAFFTVEETGTFYIVFYPQQDSSLTYSFRLMRKGSAPAAQLPIGQPQPVTFSPAHSAHLFTFNGQTGQRFAFDHISNEGTFEAVFYGPNGNYLFPVASDYEFALPSTGAFTLVIRGGESGSVQFRGSFPAAVSTALPGFGEVVTGEVPTAFSEQRFTFNGSVGQRVIYDGSDPNFNTMSVRIVSPSGTVVYGSYAYSDSPPITLLESGEYSVVLGGGNDVVGPFRFRVIDVSAPPTVAATLNSPLTGPLPSLSLAVYRLNGTDGQTLFFDNSALESSAYMRLYSPANEAVAQFPANTDYPITLQTTGEYILTIESQTDTSYALTIRTPENRAFTGTVGATTTGALTGAGESHTHTFALRRGDLFYFDGLGRNVIDIPAIIRDPSGNILANSSASFNSGPLLAAYSGDYAVTIGGTTDVLGDYSFRILLLDSAPVIGASTAAQLSPPSETDIYRFELNNYSLVNLGFSSAEPGSATWRLYRLSGDIVSSNVASPHQDHYAPGTYYLLVEGNLNDPQPISYNIAFSATASAVNPLGFGGLREGTATPTGLDFAATGNAGESYFFDSLSPGNSVIVDIIHNATDVIVATFYAGVDAASVSTLPETGAYTIRARVAEGAAPEAFAFRIIDLRTAPAISLNARVTGSGDVGYGAAARRVNLTAGETYYLDALSMPDVPSNVYLVSPSGTLMLGCFGWGCAVSNQDYAQITATETGPHAFIFAAANDQPAPFDFALRTYSTAPVAPLNQEVTASISPHEARLYRFNASAGQRLFFRGLEASSSASGLAFSPPSHHLGHIYTGGNTELQPVPTNAEHYFYLSNPTGETAPSRFRLETAPDEMRTVQLGAIAQGTLVADEHHMYAFNFTAGQRLYYDSLEPLATSVIVQLLSEDGRALLIQQNAGTDAGPVTIPDAGRYTLMFDSNSESPAPYRFRLLDVNAAPTLAADAVVAGSLPAHSALIYSVQTELGQRLSAQPLNQTASGNWTFYSWADSFQNQRPLQTTLDGFQGLQPTLLLLRADSAEEGAFNFRLDVGNHAPVITVAQNTNLPEDQPFSITPTVTDVESDNDRITYSYTLTTPAGTTSHQGPVVSINPAEADGPGVWTVVYTATDDGVPSLSASRTFTLTILEVNRPPVLGAIGDRSVNELSPLTFTATATDPDIPANPLAFTLAGNVPAGASINPSTGLFSWTPTEAQGPGVYTFDVVVTDTSVDTVTPNLTDRETITITVREVNTAPTLADIPSQTINELAPFSQAVSASDEDLPANGLTFAFVGSAPEGMIIDSTTGAIAWTPSEAQGPGSYTLTVRVSDSSTDANAPSLSASKSFVLTVREVNTAPVISPLEAQVVDEGQEVSFRASATDADLPFQDLEYRLIGQVPGGATIDLRSGAFRWITSEADGPSTRNVTIEVTDVPPAGVTPIRVTRDVSITVREVNRAPVLEQIADRFVLSGGVLTLNAASSDPDEPANTITHSLQNASAGISITADGRITVQAPMVTTDTVLTATVIAQDNGSPALAASQSLRVTVVPLPRIQSITFAAGVANIVTSSSPGVRYALEMATDLAARDWQRVDELTATGATLQLTDQTQGQTRARFYRVVLLLP